MKPFLLVFISILFIETTINAQNKTAIAQSANTSLSNLASPAINISLVPDKNNNHNIGNSTKAWKNLYLDSAIFLGDSICFHISDGWVNTGIGENALKNISSGYDNTATGYFALASNVSGVSNTANGTDALANNTTGFNNTATGDFALYKNTTGYSNSAFGQSALEENNGHGNAAFGLFVLEGNTGNNNVGVGALALWQDYSNASGQVAVGYSALYNFNGGSGNCTAVGSEAGYNNTSGANNTYLGYHAGNTVTTGSSNTTIGYGADVNNASYSNATAIGNFAISGASNRVRIGNGSVTSIGGAVGWTNFSDERIKSNIKQDVPGLAFINLLKPVTYNFDLNKEEQIFKRKDSAEWKEKYDIQKLKFTGFLAQEVEAAAKKINYDFSGVDKPANDKDVYGLRYGDFVVPLVKAVQELSKMNNAKDASIDSIKTENEELKSEIGNLKSEIENVKALIVSNKSTISSQQSTAISSASLLQNIPNPFSNTTTINYSIPQHFLSAKIIITDKNGSMLKTITLSNNKGSANINAATLSSGAYEYSLYVDGRLIDTRQMIHSK